MSYLLGDQIDLSWTVEVDDVDTEPTTFVVKITVPDGSVATLTTANPSAGVYTASYVPTVAGHFSWVAVAAGLAVAAADGVFDVFSPTPQTPPITGLAAPWSDAAALSRRPEIVAYNAAQELLDPPGEPISPGILADAVRYASEILFALTARQFSGLARTYCRPVARPEGWDSRSWGSATQSSYWDSWGANYSMGYGAATAPAFGYRSPLLYPHEVPLNYPVNRIERIKIDGEIIPSSQYRVDDYRLLVRTRPTPETQPVARANWPHWQALWLPDTQFNTFSVTYWYGVGPPQSGVTAAEVFAVELALDMVGSDSRLPARIREISRQGETVAVIDSLESLQKGWTGIPICDYFIASINPNKLQRRGSVWSPDVGGRVRTPTSGG